VRRRFSGDPLADVVAVKPVLLLPGSGTEMFGETFLEHF